MPASKELVEQLKRHEGWRASEYLDTEGVPTNGYGHNLRANPTGLGIRLPRTITRQMGEDLLIEDIEKTVDSLNKTWPHFAVMKHGARRDVLINMAFNLGVAKFMGFRGVLMAVESGDYEEAAEEMLDSKWARQVGKRADELARIMRRGFYPDRVDR